MFCDLPGAVLIRGARYFRLCSSAVKVTGAKQHLCFPTPKALLEELRRFSCERVFLEEVENLL